jgi:hypothetical protein
MQKDGRLLECTRQGSILIDLNIDEEDKYIILRSNF